MSVAVCCNVLQCVAVCCSVVAAHCSVLQRVNIMVIMVDVNSDR